MGPVIERIGKGTLHGSAQALCSKCIKVPPANPLSQAHTATQTIHQSPSHPGSRASTHFAWQAAGIATDLPGLIDPVLMRVPKHGHVQDLIAYILARL